MATGAYVRIKRGDRWQNIEIDQLTNAELDALADEETIQKGWSWAKFLAKWIRDNVKEQA